MPDVTSLAVEFAGIRDQYAHLKVDIENCIQAVLQHGRFIMGPEVAEFEAALAAAVGTTHCVAVANGTDALLIALMAEEIGPGDAVFVPNFTFTATAEVIALLGAHPVFVDVSPRYFNLDPDALARSIERVKQMETLQPRAVIAVDLFGLPADYGPLGDLCATHDLSLIGDGAQSIGASRNGLQVGALAPVTTTSFFPSKPLGAYGDGGALLTANPDRAERYRSISLHGRGAEKYDIERVGLNSRLDTMQAAILLAKLPHLSAETAARERLAHRYNEVLDGLVETPPAVQSAQSAWAQYSILLDNRDAVAKALRAEGIPTAIYYPLPLHRQPAFEQYSTEDDQFPVTESLCQRILSLPMNAYMDAETTDHVCDAVTQAVRELT